MNWLYFRNSTLLTKMVSVNERLNWMHSEWKEYKPYAVMFDALKMVRLSTGGSLGLFETGGNICISFCSLALDKMVKMEELDVLGPLEESFWWKTEGTNSECLIIHWNSCFSGLILAVFSCFSVFSLKFKEYVKSIVHPFWIKDILYFTLEASVFFSQKFANLSSEGEFVLLSAVAYLQAAEDLQLTACTCLL